MWSACLTFLAMLAVLPLVWSHSQMTVPRPASPVTCRLGGDPRFGIGTCAGPCDPEFPPTEVTSTYRRNQVVTIKYQRNNHGPGGFIRITIVPPKDMMNKAAHARNAFHYSCWGARTQVASAAELEPMEGVSFIGSDALQHDLSPGYYTARVRIPAVIPDGEYIFGWAWFGGTGGSEVENRIPSRIRPANTGYFGDYWTCSKVRIRGGPTWRSYTPVFKNDMRRFSNRGCMAANDELGACSYEPCFDAGSYRKPRKFLSGAPAPITRELFESGPSRTQSISACRCIASAWCSREDAIASGRRCVGGRAGTAQSNGCVEICCDFCASVFGPRICTVRRILDICGPLR